MSTAGVIMYVRFVTPLIHPASRVETGFFRASWYLYRNGCPNWIQSELEDQFDWFNHHLPSPGRVGRHFKRRNSIWGVCWFNPDAREAISRARYCAWLIEEGGLPVRSITSSRQREVLWRDAHQIVAKPTADLPKAFV
ncbi:hypothetical protein [Mesorhizobium sp. M1329]|uniref:hypothetical protein n=1 Tax=Mesorhizobium sp. M1329 TaxID=2957083 RepID=UPI003338EEAE